MFGGIGLAVAGLAVAAAPALFVAGKFLFKGVVVKTIGGVGIGKLFATGSLASFGGFSLAYRMNAILENITNERQESLNNQNFQQKRNMLQQNNLNRSNFNNMPLYSHFS